MANVAGNVQEVAKATSDACTGVQCDLTSASDIHTLTEHVLAEFGRCELLVNNAGVHPKIDGGRTLIPNCGAHYAATKAELIGLTRILAQEGAPYNITANTVAPGRIFTPLSNRTTSQVLDRAVQAIPLKRIGEPDELASVVCFLASEQSSYMTGAVIDVNGGSVMP
jgi:NAD(P)-dependent dehydrogenase (short-subunit alcohol dehydrogenase family)